jgi:hypothetical protein
MVPTTKAITTGRKNAFGSCGTLGSCSVRRDGRTSAIDFVDPNVNGSNTPIVLG